MTLLYRFLAADARTPEPLLRSLYAHALEEKQRNAQTGTHTHYRARQSGTLLADLARNPSLPAPLMSQLEQMRDLTVRKAILERPGLTPAEAIAFLGREKRLALLRHAVNVVDDPDGQLAHYVMDRNTGRGLLADVMASTRTSEDARVRAALEMVELGGVDKAAVTRTIKALRRHPVLVLDLADDPGTPLAFREQLDSAARGPRNPPPKTMRPGTTTKAKLSAWLAAPGRTVDEVISYVRHENRPALLRTVVAEFADPAGAVTRAALDASRARQVATAVLTAPDAPLDVRQEAARRVAETGKRMTDAFTVPVSALTRDDVDFAAEIAHTCGDMGVLRAAMGHLDLPPASVAAIADHLLREVKNLGPSTHDWLWLATHPNADQSQRELALHSLEAKLGYTLEQWQEDQAGELGWLLDLAAVGVDAAARGPARSGTLLPCPALRKLGNWSQTPGLVAILAAALAPRLAALDDTTAARVLTSLAGDFPGTVDELVTTTAAVVAT